MNCYLLNILGFRQESTFLQLISDFFLLQVVRVGTKKTAFANFTEIAKMLHRQPKVRVTGHVFQFLASPGTA
jgi:hypothetical protein